MKAPIVMTEPITLRNLFVVDTEREREAAIEGNSRAHARTLSVSRPPGRAGGAHILSYAHTVQQQRESPLIGTPDEIVAKLETLRAAGVEYVMLSAAGSRARSRRKWPRSPATLQRPVDQAADP
jgi:alkanesulfonate monooxygenase SsuD/methylene tetrahydromethanopterin reductase-like flavin-dependent oxidoreductase (luciferase family)